MWDVDAENKSTWTEVVVSRVRALIVKERQEEESHLLWRQLKDRDLRTRDWRAG